MTAYIVVDVDSLLFLISSLRVERRNPPKNDMLYRIEKTNFTHFSAEQTAKLKSYKHSDRFSVEGLSYEVDYFVQPGFDDLLAYLEKTDLSLALWGSDRTLLRSIVGTHFSQEMAKRIHLFAYQDCAVSSSDGKTSFVKKFKRSWLKDISDVVIFSADETSFTNCKNNVVYLPSFNTDQSNKPVQTMLSTLRSFDVSKSRLSLFQSAHVDPHPSILDSLRPDTFTLVLDLDETLIHSYNIKNLISDATSSTKSLTQLSKVSTFTKKKFGQVVKNKTVDEYNEVFFVKRPGLSTFLAQLGRLVSSNRINLVFFTAAIQSYADLILDAILPAELIGCPRLYRSDCKPKFKQGQMHSYKVFGELFSEQQMGKLVMVDDNVFNIPDHERFVLQVEPWVGNLRAEPGKYLEIVMRTLKQLVEETEKGKVVRDLDLNQMLMENKKAANKCCLM